MKICFKCGIEKPLSEFYAHRRMPDGHLNKCKDCALADDHRLRLKNKDRLAAYEKNRGKRPERLAQQREHLRRHRAAFPEKNKARRMVNQHLLSGKLTKKPCRVCGNLKVEAHHRDYSKPLEIDWLCHFHHRIEEGRAVVAA